MICPRLTRFWRYGLVGSLLIYVFTFTSLRGLISSPTTFFNNHLPNINDWMSRGLLLNSSLSSLLVSKQSILQKYSPFNQPSESDDIHLVNLHLHRDKTVLEGNMSGLDTGVLQVQHTVNQTDDQAQEEKVPNPHPFEYLINCPRLCSSVPGELFIIAYVHTAPTHFSRRMVIRQTWGDSSNYDVQFRLIFVMGLHSSSVKDISQSEIQQALYFEAEEYGDIVQEDFLDSYRNLTYKGIAALKWITNYCSRAKFVVKTDDDIFVNSFALIPRLKHWSKPKEANGNTVIVTGLLMCHVWTEMEVMRRGKWEVDVSHWNESTYPTYCSGSAFIMSTDVAISLHGISYHVPFFWVDDVYITGILPLKLGNITHTQIDYTYNLDGFNLDEFMGPQSYMYLFSHGHSSRVVRYVWKKLIKFHRGPSTPSV